MHWMPLVKHATSPALILDAFQARAWLQEDGSLTCQYRLTLATNTLRIPTPKVARAVDDLWQHTCFEAFIQIAGETAYREFNFSPSGEWAVYAFHTYRQRDESYHPIQAPHIECHITENALELNAHIPAALLPTYTSVRYQLGLTTVLEDQNKNLSYWALHHPHSKADFHTHMGFIYGINP